MVFLGRFMVSATERVEAPATSRHTRHPLWLLPSGPDQVHELVLREDQSLHRASLMCNQRVGWIIKHQLLHCKSNSPVMSMFTN